MGIGWPLSANPNPARSDFSLAITMLAQWQVFATTLGIGLPTTAYCYARETNPALRLRYAANLLMQLSAGVMTGTVIGVHAVMMLDWLPRDYLSTAINSLMLLTGLLYLISVLPLRGYSQVVRLVQHFRQIRWIYNMRRLEVQIAERVGQPSKQITWHEVMINPDYVLYTIVIAILDARKRLHISECAQARQLAADLDLLAQRAPTYAEVVSQLRLSKLQP
jgi:hypothetical protein